MEALETLLKRIIERVNINLRVMGFNAEPYIRSIASVEDIVDYCALCGLSTEHPLHFSFSHSSLPGSYFLDRCSVDSSVIFKSDVRGDELKRKGDAFEVDGQPIPLYGDEEINIKSSFMANTLVHNYSHDPNTPEIFHIHNTATMPYSNVHGAPVNGAFLGAGATIDLTTVHSCVVGEYAYIQTGEMAHHYVKPGQIWVGAGSFDFKYLYDPEILSKYISHKPGEPVKGEIIDFIAAREPEFQTAFDSLQHARNGGLPQWSALSPYALIKGQCEMGKNVFVAQRSYLDNSFLGEGSNAQENCFIINSNLEAFDVTAHGGKIINADLGKKVFVGFNSFLKGSKDYRLRIGAGSIVMPHTIIDLEEAVEIPEKTLVWGYIRNDEDLKGNSISMERLAGIADEHHQGRMSFFGKGADFVHAFTHRIEHILEANGAFFDGDCSRGHAQCSRNISFNIIQPYPDGGKRGMYPTIDIRP